MYLQAARGASFHLDCNTLLIIDQAASWCVYDLSSKTETGRVQVQGPNNDRRVNRAFFQRRSDGSLIFSIFTDGDKDGLAFFNVPYANVRLETMGKEFIATAEMEGAFNVDIYYNLLRECSLSFIWLSQTGCLCTSLASLLDGSMSNLTAWLNQCAFHYIVLLLHLLQLHVP